MLTGDKLETAISISLSCHLFTHDTKLMIIQENDLADGREAVSEALLIKATEANRINTEEQQQGRRCLQLHAHYRSKLYNICTVEACSITVDLCPVMAVRDLHRHPTCSPSIQYDDRRAHLELCTVFKSLLQASVRNVVSTAEGLVPKLGAHELPCQFDCVQYALRHAPEVQTGSSHLTIVGVQHLPNYICLCHMLHKTGYTCSWHAHSH